MSVKIKYKANNDSRRNRKNTCPAILFAVLKAYEINNLSNVFIMPSDHLFDLIKILKIL